MISANSTNVPRNVSLCILHEAGCTFLRHAIFMSHVCGNSKGREFLSSKAFISLVPITSVKKDLYV